MIEYSKEEEKAMEKNPYPGKFIAFEGIDGSGKTTQAKKFVDYLNSISQKTIYTFEHTRKGEWGEKIEKAQAGLIEKPKSMLEFQEWYVRDRLYHLEKIVIPELNQGCTVVTDRYWLSTLAYGIAAGIDKSELIKLHENILKDKFILPDITFITDVATDIAARRIRKKHEEKTLFEKDIPFLKNVRFAYIDLRIHGEFENIYLVDGNRSVDEVLRCIINQYQRITAGVK